MSRRKLKHMVKAWNSEKYYEWDFFSEGHIWCWDNYHYDEEKWWGDFSREPLPEGWTWPDWCVGPFEKHEKNPIFAPNPDGWDCGNFGGGVRNGSIFKKDGKVHYLYRGEFPVPETPEYEGWDNAVADYQCDIGLAVSNDGGYTFERVAGPFIKGDDLNGSFEDVCCVLHDGTYYMFCNRWDFTNMESTDECGVTMSTSTDLVNWDYKGIVFPGTEKMHRNACVLQDENNNAVRDHNGRFVMYLNHGLIAYSNDMVNWESKEVETEWPGGEGCFALCRHNSERPDDIVLFTGGPHTGHWYAIGEVLFSLNNPEIPVDILPRPVLHADAHIPYEMGYAAEPPYLPVSYWRDSVFFTGLTRVGDKYHVHYTGSEYYTSLAFAKAKNSK